MTDNDRRIVITQDERGAPILLTVYAGSERLAIVPMTPARAVALAADLLALVRSIGIPTNP
jgi:hypothetical protein